MIGNGLRIIVVLGLVLMLEIDWVLVHGLTRCLVLDRYAWLTLNYIEHSFGIFTPKSFN